MNAQEIIDFIASAPKKTPVKLYVREKPGQKVTWGNAHVYGGRKGKIVFGDWAELKPILEANTEALTTSTSRTTAGTPPCRCSTSRA